MRISDWSSDVCSSDLGGVAIAHPVGGFLCVARTMLAERVDRPFGIALAGEIDAHQRLGTDEAAKIEKFVGADLAGLDPAPHQIVHRRARGPGADALTPPVISAQQPAPAQQDRKSTRLNYSH